MTGAEVDIFRSDVIQRMNREPWKSLVPSNVNVSQLVPSNVNVSQLALSKVVVRPLASSNLTVRKL